MNQQAAVALCTVYSLFISGSPLFYTTAPYGSCDQCCSIKLKKDIKFHLYTRESPTKAKNIYLSDSRSLFRTNINTKNSLVIYFHGFSESSTEDNQSSQRLKNAFLRKGNYNVMLVDWRPLSAMPWYRNAVENIPIIGRYSARLIRAIHESGYSVKKMHLLGFSLGAEICGFIGKQLQEWGLLLPRITGLDPPLPLFDNNSSYRYLGPEAAEFVDVIHTDGGVLGNPKAMGHADFYPNRGQPLQPGCVQNEFSNNRWISAFIGCSHQRSWEYFEESIISDFSFPALECKPKKSLGLCNTNNGNAFMGLAARKNLRGKFYLDTNALSPYGKNFNEKATVAMKPMTRKRQTLDLVETQIPIYNKVGPARKLKRA